MQCNIFHSKLLQVLYCLSKANCCGSIRRACLKLCRRLPPATLIQKNLAYHSTAEKKRRHFFKQLLPCIKRANSCWAKHFMARKCKKISSHSFNVNLNAWRALGPVNQHKRTVPVTDFNNFPDRVYCAKNI